MLKIGEFSKLSLSTVKTLRHYEKEGLLQPVYIDQYTGYRYYETSQLITFAKILSYRQLGLSISDIKAILSGEDPKKFLEKRQDILKKQIDLGNDQLSRIKSLLLDKESESMKREVVIKEIPEYTVFYKEGVLDSYSDIPSFVVTAGEETGKANPTLKCIEPDYCFMEYLDGEYRESNIKCRYSQAVEAPGIETDTIKFKRLPSISVASIYHRGSYDNIRESYGYILNWLSDHDYEVIGHIRESYIDGMWNKDNVEDWLTEIQVPINKN